MNVKSVVENKEKFEVELTLKWVRKSSKPAWTKPIARTAAASRSPGFRKGKAPRKVIEGMYGAGVFYEDAIEEIYPQACMQAIEEKGLDSVAPPRVKSPIWGKRASPLRPLSLSVP